MGQGLRALSKQHHLHNDDIVFAIQRVGPSVDALMSPGVFHDHAFAEVLSAEGTDACHSVIERLRARAEEAMFWLTRSGRAEVLNTHSVVIVWGSPDEAKGGEALINELLFESVLRCACPGRQAWD